jgi:murein L,D-transpeptidase YafK
LFRWIVLAVVLILLGLGAYIGVKLYIGGLGGEEQPAPPQVRMEPMPSQADFVLVQKSAHRLYLMHRGRAFKAYSVALGRGGLEPKRREGDGRTPEGRYVIDRRNPHSQFHLALHISYPNQQDRRNARKLGAPPGGDIMIHGLPNGYGWAGTFMGMIDWTNGCIAVSDAEIEEIWKLVPDGTPIEIQP